MSVSNEILQAARELGEALRATPEMQAFLQADAAIRADPALSRLKAEVGCLNDELSDRQMAGEVLSPQELNGFFRLRDQLNQHPLVVERAARLKDVQALFDKTTASISSLLTVDYTLLALD